MMSSDDVHDVDPARIRTAVPADARVVAEIYNHYVLHTVVSFEEEPVSPTAMSERIEAAGVHSLPWLVAERNGEVAGYAYAIRWRARHAYRHSVEVSAYVAPERGGQGIGSALYGHLLPVLADGGIHAAMGGIVLPNQASVALHEKFGFHKVAHFREVGFKFGRWIDVGYWQRILHTEILR